MLQAFIIPMRHMAVVVVRGLIKQSVCCPTMEMNHSDMLVEIPLSSVIAVSAVYS